MTAPSMSSIKPYLVRALYDWIVENNVTPYIVVSAVYPGVHVPAAFVEDKRIVLDTSAAAVQHFVIGNDRMEFDARFGHKTEHIVAPISAILAVYAKENGRGMEFPETSPEEEGGSKGTTNTGTKNPSAPPSNASSHTSGDKSKKPILTLIKGTKDKETRDKD